MGVCHHQVGMTTTAAGDKLQQVKAVAHTESAYADSQRNVVLGEGFTPHQKGSADRELFTAFTLCTALGDERSTCECNHVFVCLSSSVVSKLIPRAVLPSCVPPIYHACRRPEHCQIAFGCRSLSATVTHMGGCCFEAQCCLLDPREVDIWYLLTTHTFVVVDHVWHGCAHPADRHQGLDALLIICDQSETHAASICRGKTPDAGCREPSR